MDEHVRSRLEQQYLSITHHSLENLIELSGDLSAVKNYFLDTRHTGSVR
jgi:hypothetical protein